jgi:hypothetical protein
MSAVERYDSRPETRQHIERVRYFLSKAATNLRIRGGQHDRSKLEEPELAAFDEATPKLANMVYGSDEYKASLKALGPALQHHFEHNDHHPEHHPMGVNDMSLMSLLEMLCDWRAASERMKQRTDDPEKVANFRVGLDHNFERFKIEPQLAMILINTARELDML